MNLLVDTHALLWWLGSPSLLPPRVRQELETSDARVYVSAAVAWEMAIKVNLGKLQASEVVSDLPRILFEKGFFRLGISMDHALRAGMLPRHHNDPFDRMLIAQAQALNCPIVSGDRVFDSYGVRRVW